MVVRRFARPMLASVFLLSGANTLRNPVSALPEAEKVAPPVAEHVPGLPTDTMDLVRINAGVQVGAGVLLATGRVPRLAALTLAGSLVPTTFAGHRFWEESEPEAKAEQLAHFLKNLSILGGLLLAVVDTGGRPSLGWRTRRAAKDTAKDARRISRARRRGARAPASVHPVAAHHARTPSQRVPRLRSATRSSG